MRKILLSSLAVVMFSPAWLWAGSYALQDSFDMQASEIAGVGSDAVGNLYVLGLCEGASTYFVFTFRKHSMEPLLSFNTGLSSPAAFAVSGSGEVSVLNVDGTNLRLLRFNNVGTFLGDAAFSPYYRQVPPLSVVIEPDRRRVYAGYLGVVGGGFCLAMIGVDCTPYDAGWVEEYDFQGTFLKISYLPGSSNTSGSCYTPSKITVDPQGNVYAADVTCRHLIKFSPDGTLAADIPGLNFTSQFSPNAMWTDSGSNLYISQPLCELPGCPPGILKLTPSVSPSTLLVADSQVGHAWDNRILYLGSSDVPVLERYVFDEAPGIPVQTSPFGTVVQHSSAAALAWQRGADPDGDPVTYSVFIGTSPAGLGLLATTDQTSFTTPPLVFGTTYYWQVAARDSYLGLPVLEESAPVVSFNLVLSNAPPGSFGVKGGTGTAVTRDDSVLLAWEPAPDLDGDPVAYELSWRPESQPAPTVSTTTATSLRLNGLPFDTTYYWSVRALDVYGAEGLLAGGQEQAYQLVFKNSAPQMAPAYLSGDRVYEVHAETATVLLEWEAAPDPDGDAVAYDLYTGQDEASLTLVRSQQETSQVIGPVSVGSRFYWKVRAKDLYGGFTDGKVGHAVTEFVNAHPSEFAVLSGAGAFLTRETSRVLAWEPSADPDGDAAAFTLYFSSDPAQLPAVYSGTALSHTPAGLEFGTTYYWSVAARDAYDAVTPNLGGVQQLLHDFKNGDPGIPSVVAGTGILAQHTLEPQVRLEWTAVSDPDGDPVSYRLDFGTVADALTAVQEGGATSYDLPAPRFDTTYYWRVTAGDEYGAAAATAVQELSIVQQNEAPGVFVPLSGYGSLATRETSQVISWSDSTDPDGDVVSYELRLSTDPSRPETAQVSSATQYVLDFTCGSTYYWQVTARDPFGAERTTEFLSFLPTFKNSAPLPPRNLSKTGTIPFHGYSPSQSFFWEAASDPDGDAFTYVLYFGTDSKALSVLSPAPLGYTVKNLKVDTPYYFKIAAVDEYGAVSDSPLLWVYYEFSNSPPEAFDMVEGSGTFVTRETSAELSWEAASDADGDAVTYRVHIGTSPNGLSPEADITDPELFLTGLPYDTTYYWTVEAYDGLGGTSTLTDGPFAFSLVFLNNPPNIPSALTGVGISEQHTLAPSSRLSWTAVTDPEDDAVTYRLRFGISPGALAVVQDSADTMFYIPSPTFGTTYYWKVEAYDPFGGVSSTPLLDYRIKLKNEAPAAFAPLSGFGDVFTRESDWRLSWQPAADADGDTVVYEVHVGVDGTPLPIVQTSTAAALVLPISHGTTYFWNVRAFDGFGGERWLGLQNMPVYWRNSPPEPPLVLDGAGTFFQHTLTPGARLAWSAPLDPDGDLVAHRLFFGTDPAALSRVQDSTSTTYTVPGPAFGTTYYWLVESYDPYGGTSGTELQSLRLVLDNAPPSEFSVLSATGTLATRASSALLSWEASADPDGDPVVYELLLSTDPKDLALVQVSEVTDFTLPIAYGTTYYWQVTAKDSLGGNRATPVQSLLPVFRNSAPSAPRNLSKTGTIPFHGYSPSQPFFWEAASDPDGDAFIYVLYFGTDSKALSVISPAPLGYTAENLKVNTPYYFKIAAVDEYEAASDSPLLWVYYEFSNSPPEAFDMIEGSGTFITRETSARLAWEPAADADGDLVTYRLYAGTATSSLNEVADLTKTWAVLGDMQFGTTYYWTVGALDPLDGRTAMSGGVQSLLHLFQNAAPARPVIESSLGVIRYHADSPSYEIAWSGAADPDGDPVSLELYFGTDQTALSPLPFPSGATTYQPGPLASDTTYFFKVAARDVYGAVSESETAWVRFVFQNEPPGEFEVLEGTGTRVTRFTDVSLRWSEASDPEGDPVLYRVVFQDGLLPERTTSVRETLLSGLVFGTTYTYRVCAEDGYGLSTCTGSNQFRLEFENSAPAAPQYASGVGASSQRTLAPGAVLSWEPCLDADGDPIRYVLALGTDSAKLVSVVEQETTSYFLTDIVFDTTYYWRVTAYDPYSGTSGPTAALVVHLDNRPPNPIRYLSPTSTRTRETSFLLAWEDTGDPDGEPVTYRLELGASGDALADTSLISSTSFRLEMDYGSTYYYRVSAEDAFSARAMGDVRSFVAIFLNDPPEPVTVSAPFVESPQVRTMQDSVDLSWKRVENPQGDPITYTILLGGSPEILETVAVIGPADGFTVTPASLSPEIRLSEDAGLIRLSISDLAYYKPYYLRIAAENPYGALSETPLQSFTLTPLGGFPVAYAYPVPFNPREGGTNIVFNAPPSGFSRAVVEIYSELQDLIFEREYGPISPGISQVRFDGRDRYGRPLFNGSYICRVRFEEPDHEETFYLMVVR